MEDDSDMHTGGRGMGRVILVVLTLWALVIVVPDLYRLRHPLGAFGFYANNDGVVTDVLAPFKSLGASPAFVAGLRPGDQLDLTQMRCVPFDSPRCASAMTALGGMRLERNGELADLVIAASADNPAREITIVAKTRPSDRWMRLILLLDQLAAIAVILAAAWLVWTRPGKMTWGFFLYVIWFNPGQSAEFYALLLHYSPAALLAQNIAGAIAQGVGSAGFIAFAIRAPSDQTSARWRPIERILPVVAVLLSALLALSYANVFGFPTEIITRAGVLSGFLVAACAFAILLMRRSELPPQDYQRLRWVIWGCLIGLPALVLADAGTTTSLLDLFWKGYEPPEQLWGLLYLVNGVLCLFVSEAVRRPYVVPVSIPLRRITILGLVISLPMLLLHREIDHVRDAISEKIAMPAWVWLLVAAAILFLMSKVHDTAVHHVDRLFNRSIVEAGSHLGAAILNATNFAEIEAHLVQGVRHALGLASASVFREEGEVFRRTAADQAWDGAAAFELNPHDPMLAPAHAHRPFNVSARAAARNHLPGGLPRPIIAVPVGDRLRCLALALYGPHTTGNDLSHDERAMLAELAEKAASAFMKLNEDELRRRIEALESKLAETGGGAAGEVNTMRNT
jgi:hypothetical protein